MGRFFTRFRRLSGIVGQQYGAVAERRQAGQAALFAGIALPALSLIAWFLVIPLRELRQESSSW